MTLIISNYKDVLQWQENFLGSSWWIHDFQRVANVAEPFLSMNSTLKMPISLTKRTWGVLTMASQLYSSEKEISQLAYLSLQTSFAIAILAGTIFTQSVGAVLITTQFIFKETQSLLVSLEEGNVEKILKNTMKITSKVLFLIVIAKGGVELLALSFCMQIMVLLIQTRDELKKDHWLEGGGHLLMALIRQNQLKKQLQLINKFKTS